MFFDSLTLAMILGVLLILIIGISSFSVYIFFRGIELAPLFEKKQRLKEEIASAHNTLSDLKAEFQSMAAGVAASNRIIAEAQSEREWQEKNHDTVASLRSQISLAQTDLKDAIDKRNEAVEKLQEIQQELQKTAGELQALSVKNERFRADNSEQEKIKDQLRKTIQELEADKTKANEELLSVQRNLSNCCAELSKVNSEIEGQKAKLEGIRHDIQNHQKTNEELNSQRLKLIQERQAEEKHLHEVTSQCIKNEPLNETLKWGDLNRPVFHIDTKHIREQGQSEGAWLDKFKTSLKDNGIQFHERMIHAFHTGLKVADYSPLVVLAGISGTGKSLLPRLYAKAIGMNFLQIAVQPRWDNPQDMFGFYNYMEGRYKATELSRMLWEFDIYNNENAKKEYSSFLPMNLVLLDEMNLAKVEYYFSDMLSKLEVRRGINEKDKHSRRNAEIEIESGAMQQMTDSKRLFVGRNTLFVGTMNEDESTQSLSDKVIDRSNVLRFGKPSDLSARPHIKDFEGSFCKPEVLDFASWKNRWLKHDSQKSNNANEIITKINNELAQIGRPFAYRVYSAILAYVNNYPESDNAFNYAMADQIEMKVLPKLNGLDKESSSTAKKVLDNIGTIIDNLHDSELAEAFVTAKDNKDEIFFQWRGVSR